MSQDIVPSKSDFEKLLEEVQKARARVIELTALRDDLLYHICPALQALYDEKIGSVERQLLAAHMYLREKQRIIELLQAQINRQEKPCFEKAQEQAAEEFHEYEEDLRKKAEEAEQFRSHWENETQWSRHDREAREREKKESTEKKAAEKREKESEEQQQEQDQNQECSAGLHADKTVSETAEKAEPEDPVQELKRLYRQIVKRLHPDVNPNPTEREKELLNRAHAAYKAGDLEEMRRIWEEIAGTDVPEEAFEDTEEGRQKLREILAKLLQRIKALEQEIRTIRSSFPYTMKTLLDDEEALEKKHQDLLDLLEEVRELNVELDEYIEKLKRKLNEQG